MNSEEKNAHYKHIFEKLNGLFAVCSNSVARMTTIAAVLHHKMDNFLWTGYYLLKDDNLDVGPYQGTLACMRLKKDTGVCWSSVNKKEVVIVPDVHKFQDHITCDSRSNSEIVIPLFDASNNIVGVLDVDSELFSNFDEVDALNLVAINTLVFKQYE
jgi:L-methionine (R)-S-oxide reductase